MNTNSSSHAGKVHRPKRSRSPHSPATAYHQKIVELCNGYGCKNAGLLNESFLASEISDQFLFWSPVGLPIGDSVSVSSSRLGQKLDQQEAWFDAIRTLAVQLQNRSKFLITGHGTTTHRFLKRIAAMFGIPLIEFKPFPSKVDDKWFKHIVQSDDKRQQASANDGPTNQIIWFEQIHPAEGVESKVERSGTDSKFNIDDLLVAVASCAVLLSVRKSGKILAAVNRRLELQRKPSNESISSTGSSRRQLSGTSDKTEKTKSTKLLINRKLTSKKTESNLLDKGASGWWLYRPDSFDSAVSTDSQVISKRTSGPTNSRTIQPVILDPGEIAPDQFLLHWTRRRVGPWPDQTQNGFLDDLIFRNSRSDHSQLSSLCRILASRRIFGSANLTRDTKPVVCFSDLTIQQLKKRRVFRPHLSRWDFEPYGLAIDRDLLKELGARRVVYGDDSSWDSLSPSERPFFQTRRSANQKINWELEREWRIVGDLQLKLIPRDRAFVFVDSEEQANVVASLCHWPIVVMNTLKK